MSHILAPRAHLPLLPLHTPAVPTRLHASFVALDMAESIALSPPQAWDASAPPAPSRPPSPLALPATSPVASHAPSPPASIMLESPQMHVPELRPYGIDLEAQIQAAWPLGFLPWAQLSQPVVASLLGAGVPVLGGIAAYSLIAGLQAVCQSGICGPAAGLDKAALCMGALSGGLVTAWAYRLGTHRVHVQAVSVQAAWTSATTATAVDIGMSVAMGRTPSAPHTTCYLPVLFRSAGSTAALLYCADAYLGAPPAALYALGHSATWPVATGYKMARRLVRGIRRRRWH